MTAAYSGASTVRRALLVLREEGLASFWFKLASAVGYRRLLLMQRFLANAPAQPEAELQLQFGLLEESDVDDHLAFRPELSRQRVLDRLRSAQACFVARHEGRIVSACWASTRPVRIEFLGYEAPLVAGEVYMFDAFTLPEYRGQGAAPALCVHQLSYFRGQGLKRAIRATLPENVAALRAHAKSGFHPYALLSTLRIGPWQRTIERPWRSRGPLPKA